MVLPLPGLIMFLCFYNPNALLVKDCAPLQAPTVKAMVKVISHRYISTCAQSAYPPVKDGSPALIKALQIRMANAMVTASITTDRKYLKYLTQVLLTVRFPARVEKAIAANGTITIIFRNRKYTV